MASIWEPAPAKINLALHVVGQRPDGYHLLDSLVVFCDAGDRIGVSPADDFNLTVTGPFGENLSAESDNLVLRAARGLKALLGSAADNLGAHIALEKNLPVSSGIGGGSADAAATLRVLQKLWGIDAPEGDLLELALSLGADVPVCLKSQPVFMEGIGEILTPVQGLSPLAAVLVNPGVAVSTPAMFQALASKNNAPIETRAWDDQAAFFDALFAMRNDLEAPATAAQPVIAEAKQALSQAEGCLLTRMSGSGATVFGLFAENSQAEAAAMAIDQATEWWSVSTTIRAHLFNFDPF